MNTGERIKQARTKKHMSVDELAPKIGVSRSTLFRYENGAVSKIPTSALIKIAKELNTTPNFLLGHPETEIPDDFPQKAKEIYGELLKDYSAKTYNGKALRFFDDIDLVLNSAIQRYLDTGFLKSRPKKSMYLVLMKALILETFREFYQDSVKSNANLIQKVLDGLPDENDIREYPSMNDDIQYRINELNLSVLIDQFDESVSSELQDEIISILTKTAKQLNKLKEKYPDSPSELSTVVAAIDDDGKTWQTKDGKDIKDELHLSSGLKEMILDSTKKLI